MKTDCGAVIPAGGSSTRFGGGSKLLMPLCGKPVFIYSLIAFRKIIPERNLVLCAPQDQISEYKKLMNQYLPDSEFLITAGGKTRVESVLHGLELLNKEIRIAAVHDAARPLITPEIIEECYLTCEKYGGAAAVSKPADTIKVFVPEKNELATGGLRRDLLRLVQTPQTFYREPLLEAVGKAAESGLPFTDDTSIMEYYTGIRAKAVESSTPNLKITTRPDLETAALFIREKQGGMSFQS